MLAGAAGTSPPPLTREEKYTLVGRFFFVVLVIVGLWVAGVGYREELRRVYANQLVRVLVGATVSVTIGVKLQEHWRDIVNNEWGLVALVYIVSAMACIATQRSMPWIVALVPPALLRLLDGVCRVCGCCGRRHARH